MYYSLKGLVYENYVTGERETKIKNLVLASCWETSRRVLICSEMTPNARKPTQARPAPSPNRLVKVEAIQSVDSTLVVELAGLEAFCCCITLADTGVGCSDEVALSCCPGCGVCGCEGGFCDGGGGGGGVCDDEDKW